MSAGWTGQWPTEPGWYWFYGWDFGKQLDFDHKPIKPALGMVVCRNVSNGSVLVKDGHFFYKEDGAIGLFKALEGPALPDVEHMRKPGAKTAK